MLLAVAQFCQVIKVVISVLERYDTVIVSLQPLRSYTVAAGFVEGMNRYVDEFVFGECVLVLLEIKPDLSIPAVSAGWHTVSISWSCKDVHKSLIREVVCSKTVAPMKHITLKTKDFESGSQVDQCFREF